MTRHSSIVLILIGTMVVLTAVPAHSQEQSPFTFTIQGGLFFPSKVGFKQEFGSASDLFWSAGVNLPIGGSLFLAGDIGFFRSKGFVDASADSSSRYFQRIIHVGLIQKRMLTDYIGLRLMAGVNRVHVQQVLKGVTTPERSLETGNEFGFFGGVGIEQLLDEPHVSFFLDALYDYSRSHEREFPGDFGGFRIVFGMNFILY